MGIKCSQTQNSMVLLQTLLTIDEVEQQKHQANQTLKYRFPEKQILESNKTKLQLQKEEEHPQQPEDPGSPMQAISEKSSKICVQSQFNNSCPTTLRLNAHQTNDCSFQHDQRLSMESFHKILLYQKNQLFSSNIKQSIQIKIKRDNKKKYTKYKKLSVDLIVIPNRQIHLKLQNQLDFQQRNKSELNTISKEPEAYKDGSLTNDQTNRLFIVIVIIHYITKSNCDNFEYKLFYQKLILMLDQTLNLTFKDEHNGGLVRLYHFKTIPHALISELSTLLQYFHMHSPVLVSEREDENEFTCNNEDEEITGRTRSKTQGTKNTMKPNKHHDLTEQLDLAIKPKGLLKNRNNKETQSQKKVSFSIPSHCTLEYRQIVQTAINKYQVKQKQ